MTRTGSALLFCLALPVFAQETPSKGTPVRIIVSVEGRKGAPAPTLSREDVMVYQNKQRLPATGWTRLRDDPAGLQLWILIDDGTDSSLGSQFGDLKQFIQQQPARTQIGIGYLRNGTVASAQSPTSDHDLAAKALRLPLGSPGISASPYIALTDLVSKWPAGNAAREVLMITSGIDPFYGTGPDNPYVNRAVETAQRAGIVVHSIYYGGIGHFGHSLWQINWGQNYLSQLAEETGGEFFWQGNGDPISLSPFLKELDQRLNEQYLLTLSARPAGKGLQPIKLSTEIPHTTILGPSRISVPSGQ